MSKRIKDDQSDSGRQEWSTPSSLFDGLNAERRYTVDSCAERWNAKLPRFWSPADNGLTQKWEGERVWVNPPYNDIAPWLARGITAVLRDPTSISDFLLPARTGAEWFHTYAVRAAIDYFRGRIPFKIPDAVRKLYEQEGKKIPTIGMEDSILVSVDKTIVETGFDRIIQLEVGRIGLRDAVTGKRLPIGQMQLSVPLEPARDAPASTEGACRLCGEADGERMWSSLCNAEAHPACVESAVEAIRALPPRKRAEAEAIMRGETSPGAFEPASEVTT